MNGNDSFVHFLYATAPGRVLLKLIQILHADRLAVWFLRSPLSHRVIPGYAKRHGIPLTEEEWKGYRSYRDFFVREREQNSIDREPLHLISPCDGYLSAYPVTADSAFAIKGSLYRVKDLLQEPDLAKRYEGGTCLVFRLCASDFHHYCYIDDGTQGSNHFIPGVLHSVQPIACETYPVFTLNRRSWCLLETEHFGPVVQTEIGALVVGGIANDHENNRFLRGDEKGHFELAGSTITLLFTAGSMELLPELSAAMAGDQEVRVTQGMWIGNAV